MPVILVRSLFLDRMDNRSTEDLYPSLCQDLKAQIANLLGLQDSPGMPDGWPNANCSNAVGSADVASSEWRDVPSPGRYDRKLLAIGFTQHCQGYDWIVHLRLGQVREDEVALAEECSISSFQPKLPFETIPNLLAFIPRYACKDEDGMLAGRVYVINTDRAEAFVHFVTSPERRLPIILVSPTLDSSRYLLSAARSIAGMVRGMAHVVKLQDHQAAQQLRFNLPKHDCYGGAVRIFWPGFNDTDDSALHPVWPPRRLQTGTGESDVRDQVLADILKRSPQVFEGNSDIELLEQQQAEALSRRRLVELAEQRAEQIRLGIQEQTDSELGTLLRSYQEVEIERDSLRQRVQDLENTNSELEHEMRTWKWQAQNAWQGKGQLEPDEDQTTARIVFLSAKAHKQYASLDEGERRYWDENLLKKLLDEQLRNNQSESTKGKHGSCWVFPRGETADGRRLFYYTEDEGIYVCEVLPSGEKDREYKRLRDRGVDRQVYGDFEQWRPDQVAESIAG